MLLEMVCERRIVRPFHVPPLVSQHLDEPRMSSGRQTFWKPSIRVIVQDVGTDLTRYDL